MKKLLLLGVVFLFGFTNAPDEIQGELSEFVGEELVFEEEQGTYMFTDVKFPVLRSGDIEVQLYPDGEEVEAIIFDHADRELLSKIAEHFGIAVLKDDDLLTFLGNKGICYNNYHNIVDNIFIEFSEYVELSDHAGEYIIKIDFNASKFSNYLFFERLRLDKFGCEV